MRRASESDQPCEVTHNLLTADTFFHSTSSTLCTWERHSCFTKAFPLLNIRHHDHKESGSGSYSEGVLFAMFPCFHGRFCCLEYFWSLSSFLLLFLGHNGKHGCYGHKVPYHVHRLGLNGGFYHETHWDIGVFFFVICSRARGRRPCIGLAVMVETFFLESRYTFLLHLWLTCSS